MRVFVAGGTGMVGRRLVAQLVERGHEVTATTSDPARRDALRALGADAVVMDGLDAASVGEAVAAAAPDTVVHEMTAISERYAGKPDMKHMDKWFAGTNRLRTEGTDNLLSAARAAGAHVIAQSYGAWNGNEKGGRVTSEDEPIATLAGTPAEPGMRALQHLEGAVLADGGAVLRYGWFYGPGAIDDQVELIRRGYFPIVGDGGGYNSWVHLDDAAAATVLAVEQRASGVFDICDDDPAPAREWLPHLARVAGARRPMRIPAWIARPIAGEVAVIMMTRGRAFSNAKAKRELGWVLRHPSWREGFAAEFADAPQGSSAAG
jgi:nucleoside-diphosphate-sugar epimerase